MPDATDEKESTSDEIDQKKSRYDRLAGFFTSYSPVILVILLVSAYALASIIFIECGRWINIGCGAMNGVYISYVKNPYSVEEGVSRIEQITGKKETAQNKQRDPAANNAPQNSTAVANGNNSATNENQAGTQNSNSQENDAKKDDCAKYKNEGADKKTDNELLARVKCQLKDKNQEIIVINSKFLTAEDELSDAEAVHLDPSTESKDVKAAKASKEKLTRQKAILESEKTQLENTEKTLYDEVVGIRKQISSRYSSRLTWVFFSTIYTLLCIACFIVCGFATYLSFEKNYKKTRRWLGITAIVGLIFAIIVFRNDEHYLFLFQNMFDQTLNSFGELPFTLINLSNVIGFGASAFLVAASCAVLQSVSEIEVRTPNYEKSDGTQATDDEKKVLDKELEDKKLDEYIQRISFLRSVLFVGSAMIVVGLLRVNALLSWHRTFISTESESVFVNLFNDFINTLVSIEGAFYTLLLAVIYIPAAYIIRQKAFRLRLSKVEENGQIRELSSDEKTQKLESLGLIFKLSGFLPRLTMILSPFLTGQIKELFDHFVGNK